MTGVLDSPKVTVVLVGSFDSASAVPTNLGKAGVIRPDEAEAARITVLVPGQAVGFALTWCYVTVMSDRFIVETAEPPYIKAADLALKTLGDIMPNASVNMLGINRQYTIRFSSAEEVDAFGKRLAPPSAWGAWGRQIEVGMEDDHTKSHGGLISATMRETPIAGRDIGWRDVQILAARTFPDGFNAVITLNDHFQVGDSAQAGLDAQEVAHRRTSALLRILREEFDSSLKTLEEIAQSILRHQ